MTETTDLSALALSLHTALESATAIAPIRSEVGEQNIASAYEVQRINTQFAREQGRTICGRKIGLTSVAIQLRLGTLGFSTKA